MKSCASSALRWEVTFLGSVTRAFALPDIHWCMKFLCHPEGMKLGETQEVPLSWLCPNCWQGLWRVLEKSVDPVRVCVENE